MADTCLLVGLCLSLLISSLGIILIAGAGAASLGNNVEAFTQAIDFLFGILPAWIIVVLLLIIGLYIGNRHVGGGANNG